MPITTSGFRFPDSTNQTTASTGSVGWQTAFDIDFSAEGNQTLDSDTTYTIGGRTWTKINSAKDRVAMAVVNGSGLVMQPTQPSDYVNTTRTFAGLSTTLPSEVTLDTPLRIWIYQSATNAAANYDSQFLAIENASTNTHYQIQIKRFWTALVGHICYDLNGTSGTEIYDSNFGTYDVGVLTIPLGIVGIKHYVQYGAWSSGWPTESSLRTLALLSPATTATTAYIGTIANWTLLLGAFRYNSATNYSVTVARIKLEYK